MSKYDEELLDPITNAGEASKLAQAASEDFPVIDLPEDTLVDLPAGILHNGKTIKKVTVQELNGAHEEEIFKAQRSGNAAHFLNAIIRCGVEGISGVKDEDLERVLGTLLLGDRDAILLGIRKATYGNEIEIYQWECPICGGVTDITLDVDDIPVKKLKSIKDVEFDIKLNKGAVAHARLVNVSDTQRLADNPGGSKAENDTIMLSQAVLTIKNAKGEETNVAAWPSAVRELSIPNRRKILQELVERQPGPQIDDVPFKHNDCGKDVSLSLGLGDLFPDF